MPEATPEERIARLEEQLRAVELAFRAYVRAEHLIAEDQQRDSLGSLAQSGLAPDDYSLGQDEKGGDINPRRRRIIDRAMALLSDEVSELD